ncbi:MAG: HIT family protein [Salinibacter sp.]
MVTRGHTLVAPKRHVATDFDLAEREQRACWLLANRVQSLLQDHLAPEGISLRVDGGSAAGPSSDHTALQLLPRYEDEERPDPASRAVRPPSDVDST